MWCLAIGTLEDEIRDFGPVAWLHTRIVWREEITLVLS